MTFWARVLCQNPTGKQAEEWNWQGVCLAKERNSLWAKEG